MARRRRARAALHDLDEQDDRSTGRPWFKVWTNIVEKHALTDDAVLGAWLRLRRTLVVQRIPDGRLRGARRWPDETWLLAAQTRFERVEAVVRAGLASWEGDDLALLDHDGVQERKHQQRCTQLAEARLAKVKKQTQQDSAVALKPVSEINGCNQSLKSGTETYGEEEGEGEEDGDGDRGTLPRVPLKPLPGRARAPQTALASRTESDRDLGPDVEVDGDASLCAGGTPMAAADVAASRPADRPPPRLGDAVPRPQPPARGHVEPPPAAPPPAEPPPAANKPAGGIGFDPSRQPPTPPAPAAVVDAPAVTRFLESCVAIAMAAGGQGPASPGEARQCSDVAWRWLAHLATVREAAPAYCAIKVFKAHVAEVGAARPLRELLTLARAKGRTA